MRPDLNQRDIDMKFDKLKALLITITEGEVSDHSVKWFVAMAEAETTLEGFSTKDLANLFMRGIQPMSKKRVNEWLKEIHEADPEVPMEDLIKELATLIRWK